MDNLAYGLASRAQQAIVELKPDCLPELGVLGAIDASAGRSRAAEQSFTACLAADPDDEDIKAQLDAVRSRRYAPYAVTRGFDSPQDRQLYRLRRRSAVAPPVSDGVDAVP